MATGVLRVVPTNKPQMPRTARKRPRGMWSMATAAAAASCWLLAVSVSATDTTIAQIHSSLGAMQQQARLDSPSPSPSALNTTISGDWNAQHIHSSLGVIQQQARQDSPSTSPSSSPSPVPSTVPAGDALGEALLQLKQLQQLDHVGPQSISASTTTSTTTNTNTTDYHYYNNPPLVVALECSPLFATLLGIGLAILVVFRVALTAALWSFRKHPALTLAQPVSLALLTLSGAGVMASCYLLLPLSDAHCYWREPLLLTPLTLCGNILAGRLWRVLLLMKPVLQLDPVQPRAHNRRPNTHRLVRGLQQWILDSMSRLCNNDCGCRRSGCLRHAIRSCRRRFSTNSNNNNNKRHHQHQSNIRQMVTQPRVLWLNFVMTVPQLVVQICNLTVPALREQLVLRDVLTLHHHDHAHLQLVAPVCRTVLGTWTTWLGIAVMLVPYMITGLLSLQAQRLPKAFDETEAIARAFKCCLLVLAIVGPPLAWTSDPDVATWLMTAMVLLPVCTPVWFIIFPKLCQVLKQRGKEQPPLVMSNVLRRRSHHHRHHLAFDDPENRNYQHEKSAKLALTIGRMYEDMGKIQESIDLFDEALAVWECDPGRDHKDKVGGFTHDEIHAFSPRDLDFIIQLLIAKGRVLGTFQSAKQTGQKHAAQSWLDALEIFELCPASVKIRDRSIIFPIFSGMFVFLKGDKIQQDKDCNLEQNLVRKFVRETKLHGDPVHYSRALAMQCEVKARLGNYQAALESFELLKAIYDPEEHSEGIAQAYGTDRSAHAFSQRALWNMMLGNEAQAKQDCEYVLRRLISWMNPKNILGMCELLLPIIRFYKPRGQSGKMRKLFDEHVIQNFNKHFGKDGVTPCLPLFEPMLMLLDICTRTKKYTDLDHAKRYLLDDNMPEIPDFLDSVYTKLCWSPNGMLAELCLRVAENLYEGKIQEDFYEARIIAMKGFSLAKKAARKMKDTEGTIILAIAHEIHEPVLVRLESLCASLGVVTEAESLSCVDSIEMANIDNLPKHYLNSQPNSSGSLSALNSIPKVNVSLNSIPKLNVSPLNANKIPSSQSSLSNASSMSVPRISSRHASSLASVDEETSISTLHLDVEEKPTRKPFWRATAVSSSTSAIPSSYRSYEPRSSSCDVEAQSEPLTTSEPFWRNSSSLGQSTSEISVGSVCATTRRRGASTGRTPFWRMNSDSCVTSTKAVAFRDAAESCFPSKSLENALDNSTSVELGLDIDDTTSALESFPPSSTQMVPGKDAAHVDLMGDGKGTPDSDPVAIRTFVQAEASRWVRG